MPRVDRLDPQTLAANHEPCPILLKHCDCFETQPNPLIARSAGKLPEGPSAVVDTEDGFKSPDRPVCW